MPGFAGLIVHSYLSTFTSGHGRPCDGLSGRDVMPSWAQHTFVILHLWKPKFKWGLSKMEFNTLQFKLSVGLRASVVLVTNHSHRQPPPQICCNWVRGLAAPVAWESSRTSSWKHSPTFLWIYGMEIEIRLVKPKWWAIKRIAKYTVKFDTAQLMRAWYTSARTSVTSEVTVPAHSLFCFILALQYTFEWIPVTSKQGSRILKIVRLDYENTDTQQVQFFSHFKHIFKDLYVFQDS